MMRRGLGDGMAFPVMRSSASPGDGPPPTERCAAADVCDRTAQPRHPAWGASAALVVAGVVCGRAATRGVRSRRPVVDPPAGSSLCDPPSCSLVMMTPATPTRTKQARDTVVGLSARRATAKEMMLTLPAVSA